MRQRGTGERQCPLIPGSQPAIDKRIAGPVPNGSSREQRALKGSDAELGRPAGSGAVRQLGVKVWVQVTIADPAQGGSPALRTSPRSCPDPHRTNAEQGREILKNLESDRFVSKPTMLDAARTAVELAGGSPR